MRMPLITTLSHNLPQTNQASTGSSVDAFERSATMMTLAASDITMVQQWLNLVPESQAKDHAHMILPDIISRYRKRSETVQNHEYYMYHFGLSKDQVRAALQCLEDSGILTRLTFCNLMTEEGGTFNILTLSHEVKDLIRTQGSGQPQDNNAQGESK